MTLFCLINIVIFLLPGNVRMCPDPCKCYDELDHSSVLCDHQSLTKIPEDIPINASTVQVSHNAIAELPVNAFKNLTRLRKLYLDYNLLDNWPPQVFNNIPLRYLSINYNNISLLNSEMFSQLINLTFLSMTNNYIVDLESGVFESLMSLEDLKLDNNNIEKIPNGAFSGLVNLRSLYLDFNNIHIISAGAFSVMTNLERLYLTKNKLRTLHETTFDNLMLLNTLSLNLNSITELPGQIFSTCVQLENLFLDSNNLTTLPPNIFTKLANLDFVTLGSNPWLCDCRLQQGLVRWIRNSSLADRVMGRPTCSSPPQTLGLSLRDAWSSLSCQHGTCYNGTCLCDRIWAGIYCQDVSLDQLNTPVSEQDPASIAVSVAVSSASIAVVLILTAGAGFIFYRRWRKRKDDDDETIYIDDFLPFDREIHWRRMQEPPPVPPRPQFPGLEVDPGRLTLGQRIGSGAFGVVYAAVMTRDGNTRDVVVKTLKDSASEEEKLSFLEEIRSVVDLGAHDNLLGLVGCSTLVRDHLYLITEFMPYGDLKNFLLKCREEEMSDSPPDGIYDFQTLQMYQVARQIARGMDHIARSRYVHGDLAARNVLVGEHLKVKISDFGLAEDIYSRGYRRQDRLKKVPWKWMAPERLQDGTVYTAQSDVWSFGIVLYEISTLGGDPYPDVPPAELKDRLQAGHRMAKPERCPPAMYGVMTQCWSWRPNERPTFRQLELSLDKQLSFYGPDYARVTPSSSAATTSRAPQN
ncbi:uncharacterized protein LOC118406219 [Branchiostoma floridae]|uniref:Uncharacterized protein LOC118406219 n=1 Tax=Branchiostoma floridae TaxID=7739 RepID=A0A9J7KGL0_BRAFL|nr:uncharacterized protein LOC118406219 [Branchiostoma floridae]